MKIDLNEQSFDLLEALAEKRQIKEPNEDVKLPNLVIALIAEAYRIEVKGNLKIDYVSDNEYEERRRVEADAENERQIVAANNRVLREVEIKSKQNQLEEDEAKIVHAQQLRIIETEKALKAAGGSL